MSKLVKKGIKLIYDVKNYWHKPKEGEYVSYKEFSLFCMGASGNNCASTVQGYLTFVASCFLIGAVYGVKMEHIYILGLISLPLSYLWNPINMLITDNLGKLPRKTNIILMLTLIPLALIGIALFFIPQKFTEGILPALPQIIGTNLVVNTFNVLYKIFVYRKLSPKFGKFRPWIIAGILPALIFFFLIIFIPFEGAGMQYYTKFWLLNFLFSFYNLFSNFTGQIGNIQNVISPNSEERVKIISIGSLVYSALPSLVAMLIPILSELTGGLNSIGTYRIIIPIFMFICSLFTLLLFFGVKEKVVVAKTHKIKIKFWQGIKSVSKNKYFWLTNVSGVLGGVSTGAVLISNILFVYSLRQDWLVGVYGTIIGTAFIPGMIFAPMLIKKFDKRNILVAQRVMSMVLTVGIYFAVVSTNVFLSTVLFIVFNYITTIANSPSGIAGQAMTADIWDYQQYLSGERMDGFSGIFGMILLPISTIFGMIMPALYSGVGFTSDWDILYDRRLYTKIMVMTIIMSVVSAFLGTIPYLFYDLTNKKHKDIMKILNERAVAEDIDESGEIINIDETEKQLI